MGKEEVSGSGEAVTPVRMLVLIEQNRSRHLGFCTCIKNLLLQQALRYLATSAESSGGGFDLGLSL